MSMDMRWRDFRCPMFAGRQRKRSLVRPSRCLRVPIRITSNPGTLNALSPPPKIMSSPSKSLDVVCQIVVMLVDQMLQINKLRRSEESRLIHSLLREAGVSDGAHMEELVSTLARGRLRSLSGDYVRGESPVLYEEFRATLRASGITFASGKDGSRNSLNAFIATMKKISQMVLTLRRTDVLIDRAVYMLFQLDPTEVALIESKVGKLSAS